MEVEEFNNSEDGFEDIPRDRSGLDQAGFRYVVLIQHFRLIMIKSENISIAKSVSTACQYSTNKCQIYTY